MTARIATPNIGLTNRRGLYLHVHILGFHHPFRNKKMKFVSPLPEYFASISSTVIRTVSLLFMSYNALSIKAFNGWM
jgi:hypothetical protein